MIKKWLIAFGIITASCILFLGTFWVFLQVYIKYGTWAYSIVSVVAIFVGTFLTVKSISGLKN